MLSRKAFDKRLFVSWQFRPSWALNVAAGYPVEQLQLAPQTDERFETLALAYTPPGAHWDASVFVAHQRFQELTDREAVGANLRYLASKVSLVSVFDYDIFYHSLNTASLLEVPCSSGSAGTPSVDASSGATHRYWLRAMP